jgi:hypothetical protein
MKILYIGPYRQNNSDGYASINLLLDCYNYTSEVVSRPIFNSQYFAKLEHLEKLLSKTENNDISTFDVIVQHLDIRSMIYTSKIPKYIFIPLLNKQKLSFIDKQKILFLQNKGLFVSYDQISSYILKNELIDHKEIDITVDSRLVSNATGSFNFGLYNKYQKYYSIVDSSNENNIKKLIIDFIQKYQNDMVCLVFFMTNVSQLILDQYNSYIKNIYQNLKINHSINKIIIAPVELNHEILSTIHHTGNIYLDLDKNILFNYAQAYHKTILSSKNNFKYFYDISNIEEYPVVDYDSQINWSEPAQISNTKYPLSKALRDYVQS